MSPSPKDLPPDDEGVTIPIRRETQAASSEENRSSIRNFLLVGICVALAAAGVLAGLRFFLVDDIPEMTQEALQAAMQQWQARGPASYDLDVKIGGAQPGVVRVEVREGVVKVATRDGLPLQDWNWDVWSIPRQFEELEREFEFQEDPVGEMNAPPGTRLWLRCEFDPELGYPRRFHRYSTGGAPEVYWRNSIQPK